MKIEERLKKITVREVLTKVRILSLALLIINVIVLFVSAYSYILFGVMIGVDKLFAIVLVSFFLVGSCVILWEEGY